LIIIQFTWILCLEFINLLEQLDLQPKPLLQPLLKSVSAQLLPWPLLLIVGAPS
jgi:hypothetical protein